MKAGVRSGYLGVVFDRVSVGEEPALVSPTVNHEARAVGGDLAVALPGQGEVGPAVDAVHLDHARHRECLLKARSYHFV